jgi:RNA polymerase sigma-70 factor (ECF subfamily)
MVTTKMDLETAVSEHYAVLYRFGCALAKNEVDAADLTQQTFLIFARHHSRLREPEKVRGWLFTTLRREFLRRLQSRTLYLELPFSAEQHDIPTTSIDAPHRIDAKLVLEELVNVDERYRTVLELFYLGDLSYKEISAALRVPVGTVMSRLSRGKKQLRRALSDNFGATGFVKAFSSEATESETGVSDSDFFGCSALRA